MPNANQFLLLADHIKLSLLERQRAISLNLEPTSQDGQISRSLDSLREGLEKLTLEQARLAELGDHDAARKNQDLTSNLRSKYDELMADFRGDTLAKNNDASAATAPPGDLSLTNIFMSASKRPQLKSSSSSLKTSFRCHSISSMPKSVRFSDTPGEAEAGNLFPYRDDPTTQNHDAVDNRQLHNYHSKILARQDQALDKLGESIGRQRELSIQIGDELDEHVHMLDEVDHNMNRHQSRLDHTMKDLRKVARKAQDNKHLTIIAVLIIVLVFLIIIVK